MTPQGAFHAPQDSRRFPTWSIGDFRVARFRYSSDISDMDGDTLRERLRERLAATGKKPIPLATEIGKGRDYLSDILNGKKHTLSSDVLTPLAIALQCDERYFTDEGFKSPGRSRRRLTEDEAHRFSAAAERHNAFAWAWRIYRNLSLQDVAADSGLTAGTISDIEQGLLQPTTDQLNALARAFSTNAGLLKTNPFETNERVAQLISITEALDPTDLQTLVDMAESLERRKAV